MGDNRGLCDLFEDPTEFGYDDWGAGGAASPDNLLSILRALEDGVDDAPPTPLGEAVFSPRGGGSSSSTVGTVVGVVGNVPEAEGDSEASRPRKRMKTAEGAAAAAAEGGAAAALNLPDGQHRMSHITVERNRRKQMNEHLSVLRSLMPCFYVKRGDQASIIGGVVEYIKELQQILRSLEAKKQRKAYSEVLSPRPVSSPRPPPSSPRRPPPPCSPRIIINLPASPRTPQPAGSPYKPRVLQQQQPAAYLSPAAVPSSLIDPCYAPDGATDLAANSKSPVADVEVKFSGPNVLLKTISPRIPGQAVKIIATLERLPLEILHLHVNTVHDTVLKSFTIKIGIECGLSAEELADEVQQTFSC